MTERPLVSVVIPVYNGASHLGLTLTSILGQTYEHFELLATDDGSHDATWEILSAVAATDQRVKLFRNERNLGVPATMNRLFSLASGPLVTRHDADDVSEPERFAKQVAYLLDHPAIGVLGTRTQFIDPIGQPLDLNYFAPVFSNDAVQAELLRDNCLCQGSVMFRRVLLDQVGLYDLNNIGSEDYDLWLRLAEVTQFAVLEEVLYRYRVHPASLSHRRRYQQAFHAAHALEQAVQRRYGASASTEQRQPVAHYYLRAAVAAGQAGDMTAARDDVQYALQFCPQVLDDQAGLTQLLLPQITATSTTADALGLVQSLFAECLPPARSLARLKSQWLAEIHMRAVFRDRRQMPPAEWRHHLWLGIRYQPSWLLNRGVLSLLLKPQPAQLQHV